MDIEQKLTEKVLEITDLISSLSHWEGVLVLEMVRSGLDMDNMARALTEMKSESTHKTGMEE